MRALRAMYKNGRIPVPSAEALSSQNQSAGQKSCYRAMRGNEIFDLLTDF